MTNKFIKPREKFFRYGLARLTNTELIALILGFGTRARDVFSLSKAVNNLIARNKILDHALLVELLGKNKSAKVIAAIELGQRLSRNSEDVLINARDVWMLMSKYSKAKKEYFVAFYLSAMGELIHHELISIGSLDMTIAHPREIFEPALKNNAAKIIVAHNHPSGSLIPSNEDISVTERLVSAGKILGIELIDHVIVTGEGFKSIVI